MESLAQVDVRAKDIIDSLAKKHKLDMVLSSQSLLYSKPEAIQDLTSEFVEELNDQVKVSSFEENFKKHSLKSKK